MGPNLEDSQTEIASLSNVRTLRGFAPFALMLASPVAAFLLAS